jgi:predicted chitinase
MLNLQYLKGTIPDSVYNKLPEIVEKYDVNTILRMSHFLSQCSHESQGFKVTEENLYYSVNGLLKILLKSFNGFKLSETITIESKDLLKVDKISRENLNKSIEEAPFLAHYLTHNEDGYNVKELSYCNEYND